MLIRQGRAIYNSPNRFNGSNSVASDTGNAFKGGGKNRYFGAFSQVFGALPSGNIAPSAIIMPIKPGAMKPFGESSSVGLASGAGGRSIIATGEGLSEGNVSAGAIVPIIATGVGTSAGSITASGAANILATGTGISTGSIELGGIITILSVSGNASSLSNCVLTALGYIEATGGGAPELSPEGLSLELLDNQDIETGYSLRESLKIILAALGGKVSGAGTSTITFRNVTDDKSRIVADVDTNGNRTTVTLDVT